MADKDTDGGSDKGQAVGYADDLEKAFADAEAVETDAETEQAEPEEAAVETETDAEEVEADGSDADVEAEAEVSEDLEQAESEEGDTAVTDLDAPEHWSQDDKDTFAGLPDEAKPLYLDKVKSLESGFNRKFEDLASERKELESYSGFKELFSPYEGQLHAAGHTPESYTRNLVNTALALRTNPVEAIKSIASQHGVDLSQIVGKPEGADTTEFDEFTDPAILKLHEKVEGVVNKLDQSFQTQQVSQEQAQNAEVLREWQSFVTAKGEDGTELHPGAAKLQVFIGTHLQTDPPKPGESTADALARAYDAVKAVDPEIRQSILDAELKAEAAKREKERKAGVEKAKKAGRTVKSKSKPVSEKSKPAENWGDELSKVWDEATEAA